MISSEVFVRQFLDSLPYDREFMEGFIFLNGYGNTAINALVGGFYGYMNDPKLQEFLDLIDGNGYCIKTHRIESHIYYFRTKRV